MVCWKGTCGVDCAGSTWRSLLGVALPSFSLSKGKNTRWRTVVNEVLMHSSWTAHRQLMDSSWTAHGWAWFVDVGEGCWAASYAAWVSVIPCYLHRNCSDRGSGGWAGTQWQINLVYLFRVADWCNFCGQDVVSFHCGTTEKWLREDRVSVVRFQAVWI